MTSANRNRLSRKRSKKIAFPSIIRSLDDDDAGDIIYRLIAISEESQYSIDLIEKIIAEIRTPTITKNSMFPRVPITKSRRGDLKIAKSYDPQGDVIVSATSTPHQFRAFTEDYFSKIVKGLDLPWVQNIFQMYALEMLEHLLDEMWSTHADFKHRTTMPMSGVKPTPINSSEETIENDGDPSHYSDDPDELSQDELAERATQHNDERKRVANFFSKSRYYSHLQGICSLVEFGGGLTESKDLGAMPLDLGIEKSLEILSDQACNSAVKYIEDKLIGKKLLPKLRDLYGSFLSSPIRRNGYKLADDDDPENEKFPVDDEDPI